MFTAEQAQGLGMFLTKTLENEYETTKKVLAALPQNQLEFKLGDKGRTAQELAWHIVETDIWFAQGIVAQSFAMPDAQTPAPATVQEMLDIYNREFPPLLAKVKALPGDHLATPISFFNTFNLPAVMYLSFLNNHCIHHRGQLSTYLRAMNAKVPSIYGGSADEPFEMPASA